MTDKTKMHIESLYAVIKSQREMLDESLVKIRELELVKGQCQEVVQELRESHSKQILMYQKVFHNMHKEAKTKDNRRVLKITRKVGEPLNVDDGILREFWA